MVPRGPSGTSSPWNRAASLMAAQTILWTALGLVRSSWAREAAGRPCKYNMATARRLAAPWPVGYLIGPW
jgi:hypothetical protein